MIPQPSGYIVVVGSLNMDLVVRAPHHPAIGETVIGGIFHTFPGGKGANQAVSARRLGASVKMIGRVGKDDFGEALVQTLQMDGIDTSLIFRSPEDATGVALITVNDSGQNTIVVASGANFQLSIQDVEIARETISQASALIVQLESPLSTVSFALEVAHQYGVMTILNPAPAQPLAATLLKNVDYLVPNEGELAVLSGSGDLKIGIKNLQRQGVNNLIVTLGENGSTFMQAGATQHLPAFKVEAVDTTAAGDAFVGAFAVALTQGMPLIDAVRWGNAAGAIAASRPGAQPSIPDRKELLDFLAVKS